jgi:RNA polymerase sigma factor (sigma-70 family)
MGNTIFAGKYHSCLIKKPSDKKLVEGIKKGNADSIRYIYSEYFEIVKTYITRNSGTEDDAYDIFQDSLMAVFKKFQLNGFTLKGDLKGYIYGIAKNLWYEQLRRKGKSLPLDYEIVDDIDLSKLLDTPIEQIVQRAFLKLKPDCRKILELHVKGLDYEQIASEMNFKSPAYARRKKYLCKEALIELIKSDPDYRD